MIRRRPADQRGFTLLEVLVASVIAAIAMAVLFEGVSSGLRSTHVALRREQALVRARSHLAALVAATALIPGQREGDDGGGYRWRLNVRPLATTGTASGPTSAAAGTAHGWTLYDVRVGIDWDGGHVTLDSRVIGPPPGGESH